MFGRYTGRSQYDLAAELRHRRPGDRHPAGAQPRGAGHPAALPPPKGCRMLRGSRRRRRLRADHRRRGARSPSSSAAANARADDPAAKPARRRSPVTPRPRRPRGPSTARSSTGLRILRPHARRRSPTTAASRSRSTARGDLDVDEHHTMEDVAIVLGEAIDRALGSKVGHRPLRLLPCRWTTAGRMVLHRLRGPHRLRMGRRIPPRAGRRRTRPRCSATSSTRFACAARCNLHISARGDNEHHKAEGDLQGLRPGAAHGRGAHPASITTLPSSKGSPMTSRSVDYDTGNLRSVADALRPRRRRIHGHGRSPRLLRAGRPGDPAGSGRSLVGDGADSASGDSTTVIPSLTQPVLGICIGMQLMCLSSEEGDARCLGIFPTRRPCGFRPRRPTARGSKSPTWAGTPIDMLRAPLFDGIGRRHLRLLRPLLRAAGVRRHDRHDRLRQCRSARRSGAATSSARSSTPKRAVRAGARILHNFLNL